MTAANADRHVELHVRLGGPDATATQWDEIRTVRHSRLTQRARQLGWLYGTAVNLLPMTSKPGVIAVVTHCVREIYNRFPDWDGVKIIGAQNESDDASKALADIWPEVDPPPSGVATEPSDRDHGLVEIPKSHQVAVDAVVYWRREGHERNLKRALWFVGGTGAMSVSDPTAVRSAGHVAECMDFFVHDVHIGPNSTPPPQHMVNERFIQFERILDLAMRDALAGEDALNDVLRRANCRGPGQPDA